MKWKPNPANITFRVGLDELPAGAIRRAEELSIKVDEHWWNVEQSGERWIIWTDVDDEPVLVSVYVDEGEPAPDEVSARERFRYTMALAKGKEGGK
jgi:hypothetical protein